MPPRKVNNCDNCSKSYSSKFLHQCLACSSDGQIFICDQCTPYHAHFTKAKEQASSSKKEEKKSFDTPIHTHDDFVQVFASTLNLPVKQAKEICMVNMVKRVDKDSKEGKVIVEYFTNSLVKEFATIENIWSLNNKVQDKKLEKSNMNTTNPMMLWNGALYQNVPSLLTSGFQVPDQHDRVNKKPKHLYFHDRIVKEAVIKAGNNQGVLLLNEVTLGRINIGNTQNSYDWRNPGENWDSKKWLGTNWPDESNVKYLGKAKVPAGETVFKKSSVEITKEYNEYVVWDIERINIKFIVHFKRN